ncbi:MAG: hypothetical protein J2P49_00485 [Methylocapsa sp.]|nr:hypothetical protein [Methylocapsa sp.]
MNLFGTLWFGPVSAYEISCLDSFIKRGHQVYLYTYDEIKDLPLAAKQIDASEILDRSYLSRFIYDGKPSVTAFADYFRYLMFLKTDLCWIDADVFLLHDFDIGADGNFLLLDEERRICTAILRINGRSPQLKRIIAEAEALIDKDLPWGAMQNCVAKAFRKEFAAGDKLFKRPEAFMPVHYKEYYKFLLPEYADECAQRCKGAKTVHLYNNILDRIGVYKNLLPPAGSYLNHLFTSHGHGSHFIGTYPASVMRSLIEGWRMRLSGECLGVKNVVKQIFPSLRRSIKKIIWNHI